MSCGVARPILIRLSDDVRGALECPSAIAVVVDVDHGRCGMPERACGRGDARAHQPARRARPRASRRRGLTVGSRHARITRQAVAS